MVVTNKVPKKKNLSLLMKKEIQLKLVDLRLPDWTLTSEQTEQSIAFILTSVNVYKYRIYAV